MAFTLEQIVDQAQYMAGVTGEEARAEAFLPVLINRLTTALCAEEGSRRLLRRPLSIPFSAGSAALPAEALTAYASDFELSDPTDQTIFYSLVADREELRDALSPLLGHFCLEGQTIYANAPGGSGVAATTLSLIAPCALELPATASTALAAPDEVSKLLIRLLAEALAAAAPDAPTTTTTAASPIVA